MYAQVTLGPEPQQVDPPKPERLMDREGRQ
jgi:hypothetical protein